MAAVCRLFAEKDFSVLKNSVDRYLATNQEAQDRLALFQHCPEITPEELRAAVRTYFLDDDALRLRRHRSRPGRTEPEAMLDLVKKGCALYLHRPAAPIKPFRRTPGEKLKKTVDFYCYLDEIAQRYLERLNPFFVDLGEAIDFICAFMTVDEYRRIRIFEQGEKIHEAYFFKLFQSGCRDFGRMHLGRLRPTSAMLALAPYAKELYGLIFKKNYDPENAAQIMVYKTRGLYQQQEILDVAAKLSELQNQRLTVNFWRDNYRYDERQASAPFKSPEQVTERRVTDAWAENLLLNIGDTLDDLDVSAFLRPEPGEILTEEDLALKVPIVLPGYGEIGITYRDLLILKAHYYENLSFEKIAAGFNKLLGRSGRPENGPLWSRDKVSGNHRTLLERLKKIIAAGRPPGLALSESAEDGQLTGVKLIFRLCEKSPRFVDPALYQEEIKAFRDSFARFVEITAAGGSKLSNSDRAILKAVNSGGRCLETLSRQIGTTPDKLKADAKEIIGRVWAEFNDYIFGAESKPEAMAR